MTKKLKEPNSVCSWRRLAVAVTDAVASNRYAAVSQCRGSEVHRLHSALTVCACNEGPSAETCRRWRRNLQFKSEKWIDSPQKYATTQIYILDNHQTMLKLDLIENIQSNCVVGQRVLMIFCWCDPWVHVRFLKVQRKFLKKVTQEVCQQCVCNASPVRIFRVRVDSATNKNLQWKLSPRHIYFWQVHNVSCSQCQARFVFQFTWMGDFIILCTYELIKIHSIWRVDIRNADVSMFLSVYRTRLLNPLLAVIIYIELKPKASRDEINLTTGAWHNASICLIV